ncbi:protein FRG1 homolog [Hyalella azteca]|uniref:Protein FRG1 homolog n=1 Tax=Hyalella azteca TaxID=294128 RepID=A0A8B7PPN8_HYAAZ|nr:protein FRG1 homolog [Hyalella azteca]
MSTDYQNVKVGKLRLKGEKVKKHKSKKRKHDDDGASDLSCSQQKSLTDKDTEAHGGWWKVMAVHEIRGSIAIQMGDGPVYMRAMDDGLFALGPPHDEGDGPHPEEVLTALPTGDIRKVAFKSGYGKYVGVDSKGRLIGRAEAIGPREMFTPVYQDGKAALLCSTECFVGIDDEDNIVATNTTAGPLEMISIRSNTVRAKDKSDEMPAEEQGSLKDVEVNYVKKFQKFQDKKMRVNKDGYVELRDARDAGKLHETLLDRRAKMKADRYCK